MNSEVRRAIRRVNLIGQGGNINTTYKLPVRESLPAFRNDLVLLCKQLTETTDD